MTTNDEDAAKIPTDLTKQNPPGYISVNIVLVADAIDITR
jgi:hypothetical protein